MKTLDNMKSELLIWNSSASDTMKTRAFNITISILSLSLIATFYLIFETP